MLRVFATCNIGEDALNRVREQGIDLEVYDHIDPPPKQLILEKVRSGIDGLITTLRDVIDWEIFEAGSETLKVVAQDAVGFDNIERKAANHFKIPFTNTADVLTHATAEFAFFILGCASRKLYASENMVRELKWSTWHPSEPFLGDEVTGKTVGVVGTGRIGKAFALKCTGFGMNILCCDEFEDQAFVDTLQQILDLGFSTGLNKTRNRIEYQSFDQVLQKSDYISLHVPLTPETHHLIGNSAIQSMKRGAYLINTSRGPVVDENALYRALKENRIRGAALDVFEKEPLSGSSPLMDPEIKDRIRLFHHFASATHETRLSPDPEIGMAGRCVQGLLDVLEGRYDGDFGAMPYVVNKEAF